MRTTVLTTTLALWLCLAADAVTTTKKTTVRKTKVVNNAFPDTFLYSDETRITEYQGDEDTDFKKSRMPRVVQFYSPLCSHCVSFRPTYVEIARETQMAHPGVEFYAVSCSTYDDLCQEFNVHSTPVLHAFEEGSSKGQVMSGKITRQLAEKMMGLDKNREGRSLGDNISAVEDEDAEDGYVEEEEEGEDDDNPIDEPGDFEEKVPEPDDDDSKELKADKSYQEDEDEDYDDKKEEEDAYVEDNQGVRDPWFKEDAINQAPPPPRFPRAGANAAREKARARRKEEVAPVIRNTLKERVAQQSRTQTFFRRFPKAKDGFDPSQTANEGATLTMKAHRAHTTEWSERRKKLLDSIEKRKGKAARMRIEKHLEDLAAKRNELAAEKAKLQFKKVVAPPKLGERIPIVKRVVKMNNEEALMIDTTLAFLEGLQRGLFMRGQTLSSDEKLALNDWLKFLSVALPQEWGLHEVIDDLLMKKNFISQSRQNLMAIIEKHAPKRKSYSPSCSNTKIPFNCGFWKLLHTATVGIAEHRGGLALIEEGSMRSDATTFDPASAADTIRNYMAFFFPCPRCSKHFTDQYDDCDNLERCLRLSDDEHAASESDWKELAKWLWEFHNSVSVRILHEVADGKRKSNGRFSMSGGQIGPGKGSILDEIAVLWPTIDECIKCYDNEGGWNEEAVFLHLEAQYWPPSDPDPKTARLLRLEQELDPSGPGMTILLLLTGLVLLFVMRQSISKDSVQRAMLVAKSVRTGAAMTQKRSD
uniref:Sulfhydryl oxidase n=1 Tax=Amphora coffeiformis TaxID=265554 RepID=A0A7S3PE65_9STRA